jgi:hypothetical protein
MSFPNAVKYNEEHFHDREGALFTFQRARDEGLWNVLEGNVDVDDIYARLHDEKGNITSYVPVQDYLKAIFEEGYFYPGMLADQAMILMHYRHHCETHGIEVPATWSMPDCDLMMSAMASVARSEIKSNMAWFNTIMKKGK